MDFYTYGDQYLGTDSMNWWKMANSASLPAGAAIMGILFITQVLSMAGIASEKWFKGQVMMLPEEQQEKWIEMHGGKKH